ncbi:MAG: GDSL-type esterase/lipase family protein [Oscillospiraceae bacterium]
MKKKNKKLIRLQRSKIQQSVISICCMLLMISSFAWMIKTAVTTKGIILADSSSSVNADAKTDKDKESSVYENNDNKTASSKTDSSPQSSDASPDLSSEDVSSEQVLEDEFDDAAFVGDSRTVGLQMNTNIPKASFYASIGLNVSTALTDNKVDLANGNKGTVLDGMKEKKFKRIYVMFGINELGWPYPDVFQEKYEKLVNEIKKLQPDATVYVQSILPVSYKAVNTNKVFTNANVNKFNELIKNAAENTGATYLDVASVFRDSNGELPTEASTDGIHLVHDYCQKWLDYLSANS